MFTEGDDMKERKKDERQSVEGEDKIGEKVILL